ncbi:MAG: HAD family phosphatase [Hyphomicrobiaceae bacterium]
MPGQARYAVFDVGNVLIEWNPRFLFAKLIREPDRLDWFMRYVWDDELNLELDRGLPFAEGIARLVARHPDWEREIRAYDERWDETAPRAIEGNVALLEELRLKGVPRYAITNFSREKFAASRRRFPFLDTFDGLIVSAHEKLIKPDPTIFRLLLDRYSLSASNGVFIDDSARNIRAAADLGFHTVHVQPGCDVRTEVRSLGLLT